MTARLSTGGGIRTAAGSAGVAIIAGLGLAYFILTLAHLPGSWRREDFSIYYQCALTFHAGVDPYRADLNPIARKLGFEPYPFEHPADTPAFTIATLPLGWMAPRTSYIVWVGASTVCLFISMYMLFGPSAGLGRLTGLLLALLTLAFTPLADNFRWAQSQVFVLLALIVTHRLIARRADCRAGAVIGLLGLLRGFPLIIGGYVLVRRRWRALAGLAGAFLIGAVATVAIAGTAVVLSYLRLIGVAGGGRWFALDPGLEMLAANVSLDAFLARPIVQLLGAEPRGALLIASRAVTIAIKLAVLAATFRATRSGTDRNGRSYSLWIATTLVVTPLVWLHYLVLLIIPFGQVAVAALHGELREDTWRLAIASYCVVVAATMLMSFLSFHFRMDFTDWRPTLAAELGFVSLLVAWISIYRFATEPR